MIVKLENVWYTYDYKRWALRNITISVSQKRIAVIGPNGSGKTTFLKIIGLIYKPSKGQIYIDEKNVWNLNTREFLNIRRKIVYLHEKPILIRETVLDNLMYPLILRGKSREEAKKHALDIAKELNIEKLLHRRHNQLSAGEKQLVAIARALVINPSVLLLDEPTAHLDVTRRKEIVSFLNDLDCQIIFASHDYTLVKEMNAEIVLTFNNGMLERTFKAHEFLSLIIPK